MSHPHPAIFTTTNRFRNINEAVDSNTIKLSAGTRNLNLEIESHSAWLTK